ncbi:MAG: ATP-binding protein [Candidatus Onthovivens sp.]|nr:ATP-binding protein [Candidatus Onthovivens sp.]
MRKKIILINALTTFFSLIILLITSGFLIYIRNLNNYENAAKNYLSLTCSIFNGTNVVQTYEAVKDTENNIRLTIIDLDGNVVFDSENSEVYEKHLDRPEVINLNTVVNRYSKTENKDMLYIADIDDGYYIRISLDMGDVNKLLYWFIIFGFSVTLVVETIVVSLSLYFTKKGLAPINKNLAKLGYLVKKDINDEEFSIDTLPSIIDELSQLIDNQIEKIKSQKDDMVSVLNLLNQGVIALGSEGDIFFINNEARKIFNVSENFSDSNYLYLIRDIELQKTIENSLKTHSTQFFNFEINRRTINICITPITENWLIGGLIISLNDITKEENLKQVKKDFFDNASHELKSPITSIIGYSQLVSSGIVSDNKEIIEYNKKIYKEASRMNSILYDMLNIAELEQGYPVKKEDVNLKKLVLEILDAYKTKIEAKNIHLDLQIDDVKINSDIRLIDEMLRNLIDNAIKYNKENGKITINLTGKLFLISDTGIGIKKENQSRIFERFFMEDKARSKENGGTGLGLAIVKHIIETLGYKIEVISKVNVGTKFIIYFN